LFCLICASSGEPKLSWCAKVGLLISSHVRALYLNGLPEKAREIIDELKFDFSCQYDEKDSIGKRYRRQDAIGTPFSITIDHQTLTDDMVTVRDRDTMEQIRIGISDLDGLLAEKASWKSVLSTL